MASKKSGGWQKLEIDGKKKNESGFWENKNVLLWNKKKAGSIGRGPFGAHLGGHVGGPGTHLGGIVGEAEGRHYGGRRPTKWGSGGGAPRKKTI